MTNFSPDDVLVLMDPPTFKNTCLQNYMGELTNKRKFTDILSQVRINGEVHQQHLEILVCCSRQVQQVIVLSHLLHFVLERNESEPFKPDTLHWLLHRAIIITDGGRGARRCKLLSRTSINGRAEVLLVV